MLIGSVQSVFVYIGYLIVAILILLLMVTIHELGHYIAGRILKFEIKEFAIGFGPKLFSRKNKRGETISLRAFPLGGFCAFYGEDSGEQKLIGQQDKSDPFAEHGNSSGQAVDKSKYFTAQKPWKRIIVFFAGATFNIVSAFFFSFLFIMVAGYSVPRVDTIYKLPGNVENPNAVIIQVDDRIVEINGKKISNLYNYNELKGNIAPENLVLTVERGDEVIALSGFANVTFLDDEGNTQTGIGFTGTFETRRVEFWTAAWQAFPLTYKFGVTVLKSLGGLFNNTVKLTDMSGPVGTIGMIATYSQMDINFLFLLLPLIAVNLGVFNLLPIPALDGSKIIFTVIEWIRKKPVNQNVEMWIHFLGLLFLLGFVIFIDLLKLFV